ncbi:type ISP restriction/modification enzyme [Corynebacterium urealyticum]|uniref:Type ISP restriction-modification enzyme LLaBIII C-terminal specificity domain-containing protein n=1 Tax=Corynebacterium urealyticum (strain ATCC 43042 / DSM 7109) TaxID=504474 RepID=B1VHI0_CORU7|nr:type ISP restriction/modification enzyme [Corynebacterium urealyticum]QQC41361.1 hypothetical protein I6H51_06430 [Corynebacterium urealyticum]CAQ05221.1 hypothetical protein cu1261 [Corynebacterium urealyticum DSM 7109]
MKQELARGTEITVNTDRVYTSLYRPFFKQRSYFAKELNDMVYQLPSMFPTQHHNIIGFAQMTVGAVKPYSAFATNLLPDLALYGSNAGRYFSRFTWEPAAASDGELFSFELHLTARQSIASASPPLVIVGLSSVSRFNKTDSDRSSSGVHESVAVSNIRVSPLSSRVYVSSKGSYTVASLPGAAVCQHCSIEIC